MGFLLGGRARWVAVLVFGGALLLGEPVSAETIRGAITFQPPGQASGDLQLRMAPESFVAAYGVSPDVEVNLSLASSDLRLTRIETQEEHVRIHDTSWSLPKGNRNEQTTIHPLDFGPATLRIRQVLPNLTLVLRPGQEFDLDARNLTLQSPVDRVFLSSNDSAPKETLEPFPTVSTRWPNRYVVRAPGPVHSARSPSFEVGYEGRFFLLLSGAAVEIKNRTGVHQLATGSWQESAVSHPAEPTVARVRTHHVAIVAEVAGRIDLRYAGPYGHAVFPSGLLSQVTLLSAPLATASLASDHGDSYVYANESHLDVEGLLDLRFGTPRQAGHGAPVHADIEGEVYRVLEDRLTVHRFETASVGAAAAGAGLLLLVLTIVSFVRRGVAYAVSQLVFLKWLTMAPLSAKLEPGELLQNPVRRAVFDLLRDQYPFCPLGHFRRAAARALGVSSTTVYFHLRKLHAGGYLGFFQGRARESLWIGIRDSSQDHRRTHALRALLNHPAARALAQGILESSGRTQDELLREAQERLARPVGEGGVGRRMTTIGLLRWVRKLEAFQIPAAPARKVSRAPDAAASSPARETIRLVEAQRTGRFVRYRALPPLVEAWKDIAGQAPSAPGTAAVMASP